MEGCFFFFIYLEVVGILHTKLLFVRLHLDQAHLPARALRVHPNDAGEREVNRSQPSAAPFLPGFTQSNNHRQVMFSLTSGKKRKLQPEREIFIFF